MKRIQFVPGHDDDNNQHSLQQNNQRIHGHNGNHHKNRGIICYPELTYGTSKQSPIQFKGRHGVSPRQGYQYQHQYKHEFKYYSQKNYLHVIDNTKNKQKDDEYHENPENSLKFHRKKGRLSEFMDKNGWMNKTIKMMGFERDQKARQFSNRDRNKRISSLTRPQIYENKKALNPNTSADYFNTQSECTTAKLKLRTKRNNEAQKFSTSIDFRKGKFNQFRTISYNIDKGYVQQQINNQNHNHNHDYYDKKTIKNLSQLRKNEKDQNEFIQTFYTRRSGFDEQKSNNNRSRQKKAEPLSKQEVYQRTLQKWYRTTCSSKWTYREKLSSSESERC